MHMKMWLHEYQAFNDLFELGIVQNTSLTKQQQRKKKPNFVHVFIYLRFSEIIKALHIYLQIRLLIQWF